MGLLVSGGTHNFTAASWLTTAHFQNSAANSTNLTTSYVYSPNVTPGAITISGFAVLLAAMPANPGAQTMDLVLRNTTDSVDVATVTINQSDLRTGEYTGDGAPVISTATAAGGWIRVSFSPVLLVAAKNYAIGLRVSATAAGSITIYRSSTAADWTRFLITSTTAALAAADDFIVAGVLTGAGASTAHVVTMDSTANTDYGNGVTTSVTSSCSVNRFGTLIFGTSAATNYVLRLSNMLNVMQGGTVKIGEEGGTPVPITSTAILEFDCTSDGLWGVRHHAGGHFITGGSPRTAGKLHTFALLTVDAAAGVTSLTVDRDTGWLSGDEVGITPTSTTVNSGQRTTLNGAAGASSLTLLANLASAKLGNATLKTQAAVCLLTQNVKIRSVSSTFTTYVFGQAGSYGEFRWTEFRYTGDLSSEKLGLDQRGLSSVRYCSFVDIEDYGFHSNNTGAWSFRDSVMFTMAGSPQAGLYVSTLGVGAPFTIDNVVICMNTTSNPWCMEFDSQTFAGATLTNVWLSGSGTGGAGLHLTNCQIQGGTIGGININSVATAIHHSGFSSWIKNQTFDDVTIWRITLNALVLPIYQNDSSGAVFSFGNVWEDVTIVGVDPGDATAAVVVNGVHLNTVFRNFKIVSDPDTGLSLSRIGFASGSVGSVLHARFESCNLGAAEGTFRALGTAAGDGSFSPSSATKDTIWDLTLINCKFAASVIPANGYANNQPPTYGYPGAVRLAVQNYDQTNGDHRIYLNHGTVQTEQTTVDAAPGLKVTPLLASYKIDSSGNARGKGFLVAVSSGETATITARVRKNAAYNGNAPRLVVKANPAIGIASDTVLDTLAVAADTWETLSGTTAAATADGVFEVVVDADGTAGAAFVDTFTAA